MTPAFGLVAHVAMMLNGFVQPVVRAHNAALAIVVIGEQTRHSGEHYKASQRRCSPAIVPHTHVPHEPAAQSLPCAYRFPASIPEGVCVKWGSKAAAFTG